MRSSRPNRDVTARWPAVALYAAKVFIPISLLILATSFLLFESSARGDQRTARRLEQELIGQQQARIRDTFESVIADTRYLAARFEIAVEAPWEDDPALKAEMSSFSRYKSVYDQVRFLDEHGLEKIRINFVRDKGPTIVPKEALQPKENRYYFEAASRLERGRVFISPLDLNIENGRVETPFKPMVRFAAPVYTRSGGFRGVVVLNYLADILLDGLSSLEQTSMGDILLINADGYWLKSPWPED